MKNWTRLGPACADYLRVYIRQLRRKVERDPSHPRYILTEPGVGYVFRAEPEGSSTQVQPDSTSGSPPNQGRGLPGMTLKEF